MRGVETEMVKNGLADMTGSIQIHARGYLDDPVVEHSMADPTIIETAVSRALPDNIPWANRIRVNAVVSNARNSTGVNLVGIDPEKEARVSFIGDAVVEGRYLTEDDENAILVGRAFLKNFDTHIGYKLILMSQDTNGEIASKAFHIVGVFQAEMEATEKSLVFVPRKKAAEMLKLGNAIFSSPLRWAIC